MSFAPCFHFVMAMDTPAVPEQNDRPTHMLEQVLEKTFDIRSFETAAAELQVERNVFPLR